VLTTIKNHIILVSKEDKLSWIRSGIHFKDQFFALKCFLYRV